MEQQLERALDQIAFFMALGMVGKAARVLDALPYDLHTHPDVMAARVEVCLAAGQWEEAASVAESLTEFMAEEPQFWIWLAYATRRAGSLEDAEEILDRAADHHPDFAFLHHELARCAALRGRPPGTHGSGSTRHWDSTHTCACWRWAIRPWDAWGWPRGRMPR